MRTLRQPPGRPADGRIDAPHFGRTYRDLHGEQFVVFSISREHIYAEYENGAIAILCEPEWQRLQPHLSDGVATPEWPAQPAFA